MEQAQTIHAADVQALSGRAIGALFFSGFGALWLCTGLAALGRLNFALIVAIVAATSAALILPAVLLLNRMPHGQDASRDRELEARMTRSFNRVNGAQWMAIVAVVVLLNVAHRTEYIVPAVALIVGLHLFPLARLFRYPPHYVTGTLLVISSVAAPLLVPRARIAGVGSLCAATILLASAAYTLARAFAAARTLLPRRA